jgi:3-phosphoshikimate 1-carboxyvinyltransferase
MFGAVAEGPSELNNFAASADCQSTLRCLRSLGVEIEKRGDTVRIAGRGLRGLKPPTEMLDAGNSGTTIRLLSGILAGQTFRSRIGGDESLSRRPMGRIMKPLALMGAQIESQPNGLPPLEIHGGHLGAIRYSLPVASAQVKSCVLLAGMYAEGGAAVEEIIPTRNHTEIALRHFGGTLRIQGNWIEVDPVSKLTGAHLDVPADLSGAAFFIVAAALVPGSEVLLPGVGLNPRRRELVEYFLRAGLHIAVENERENAGEPRGDLLIRHDPDFLGRSLPPVKGALTAALIDEIPALAILGCSAGGLEVRDAGELRVKESDRINLIVSNLRAMGAQVEEYPDGFSVAGGQSLHGADIEPHGDHRIAMAFTVAGLAASGETRVHGAECADVSFPGFYEALASIR